MTATVRAVYENGVLRLLEPVPLREQELVTVTVRSGPDNSDDLLDPEAILPADTDAGEGVTLEAVRQALSKIPGSMADAIRAEREDRV